MMQKLIEWIARLFGGSDQQPEEINPAATRSISQDGLDLIKHYEGLELAAYLDPVGIPTIGYGDTGPHVAMGQIITEAEAERRLRNRVEREFLPGVLGGLTRQPLQYELDAMVSLAYNIGVPAFAGSTLVKRFNANDPGTSQEFSRWQYAGGKSLLGLRRRREAERLRFLGVPAREAIKRAEAIK